jgi:predicted HAD superfamily phosphohydrolase YqeG
VAVRSVATGASSFTTFFQVLPHLATVVRHMRPTWHLASLAAVTPAFLEQHGVRGMIWDVDGTLTGDRQSALAPESERPFRALLALPGVRHVILSNASEARYRQLGTMFDVPILRAYERGRAVAYRRLRGGDDTWTAADLEARLAAGWRVIRKPRSVLVEYAVKEMELDRGAVVMIGDQYMTDVAGANLGGVRSIKLPTLAQDSFRPVVKFSQRLERTLYVVLYGRPRYA